MLTLFLFRSYNQKLLNTKNNNNKSIIEKLKEINRKINNKQNKPKGEKKNGLMATHFLPCL